MVRSRRPEPLRDLPAPPVLEPDGPAIPDRIILESRRELTRRLLRRMGIAGPMLLVLWYALSVILIVAIAPTMWLFSPFFLLAPQSGGLRFLLLALGLRTPQLVLAGTLPLLGAAVSVAMVPLAAARTARMDPRAFLTEQDFQQTFSRRISGVLVAPAAAALLLLALAVLCGVPLPWKGLTFGLSAGLAAGAGAIWCGYLALRRVFAAPTVLGLPTPRTLILQTGPDPRARSRTVRRIRAQDRRHLPPTDLEITAATLGRSVLVAGRGALIWGGPLVLTAAWVIFSSADLGTVLPRLRAADDVTSRGSLPWTVGAVGALMLVLLIAAMAVAPLPALALSRSLTDQVQDLRTAPTWAERIRVNPWEQRMVLLVTLLDTLALLGVILMAAVLLSVMGELGAVGWAWVMVDLFLLAPLFGAGVHWSLRSGLRDVLYGPPGRYVRRAVPYELVAPELGTRSELANDPAVQARIRSEARAQAAEEAAEAAVRRGAPRGGPGRPSGPGQGPMTGPGHGRWTGAPEGATEGPGTGTFMLPALPGADPSELLAVDAPTGELPDFGAENRRTWDEVDPIWSQGADTRSHPIPGRVEDVEGP